MRGLLCRNKSSLLLYVYNNINMLSPYILILFLELIWAKTDIIQVNAIIYTIIFIIAVQRVAADAAINTHTDITDVTSRAAGYTSYHFDRESLIKGILDI